MKPFEKAGLIVAFALCAIGVAREASAQATPAWDSNVITITPPTGCTTGEPLSACAVTGYRIERSATQSGTYTAVATLPPTQLVYVHTGVPAGTNCYHVIATSANGDSATDTHCKTNTKPVGPPTPPAFTVTAPTAYNVRPNYTRWVFERGTVAGTARLGAACDEDRCVAGGFCVVSSRRMVVPRPADGVYVLAKCG